MTDMSCITQGWNKLWKTGRANTYSRPLASKSGGAFALPALLQLVPPPVLHVTVICNEMVVG